MSVPDYEIYAIRYASLARRRRENFIQDDLHDGPMPMDFFVWLARCAERTILVDTGFGAAAASARNRTLQRCPIDTLRGLDVDPHRIEDVVITHLHYDHAGNLGKLPKARFHVQDREVAYATGRCMRHGVLRHAYSVEDVNELVRSVFADRVHFHDGDAEIAPGVELLLIGGHTHGLQSVRVHTARGWVVLASDASHYYENMERGRPFPIVYNVADMLDGHRRLAATADSPDHIVPGHDPEVLKRYPAAGVEGVACLHRAPIRSEARVVSS
ncbi:MAG TPA: N-acyl homoserine lactonase family protein [Myxococcota bacterium]|nr:N-acyl homoserine lactonase family protein [Myxococcota bacterium]